MNQSVADFAGNSPEWKRGNSGPGFLAGASQMPSLVHLKIPAKSPPLFHWTPADARGRAWDRVKQKIVQDMMRTLLQKLSPVGAVLAPGGRGRRSRHHADGRAGW